MEKAGSLFHAPGNPVIKEALMVPRGALALLVNNGFLVQGFLSTPETGYRIRGQGGVSIDAEVASHPDTRQIHINFTIGNNLIGGSNHSALAVTDFPFSGSPEEVAFPPC